MADKTLHQLQTTGPSLYQPGPPLAVTTPQVPTGEQEAGDGSWVAALIIGTILVGMILAIVVILLWKCCMRSGPALASSHWAGRSPFSDGDTPDLFMDSDQDNKRSSVLFMLPWKLKQGRNLQQDPSGSENPSHHTTSNENGQLPPPDGGGSGAATAAPSTDLPPAPSSEPGNGAGDSCPHPDTPPESQDLPPPPDWLRESTGDSSSDPSKHSAFHLEAEEPLPLPPELLTQELHEPLPQPEHPLETAKINLQDTPHSS
ncbi:protein EVI2B [Willisornis vidua]|uniref:Protein EVI2B n=1 Tax=Willisornis vidua TaxID=1566151 RepID=A0ABQ9CNZ8_9PASS|nr:protein EVI2B [Willisornis vidua]